MKLLRIGKYLINPQCISRVWISPDASQVKVCFSCCNSVVGVVSPCVALNGDKLEKLDTSEIELLGEEAEALKLYFSNPENVIEIS